MAPSLENVAVGERGGASGAAAAGAVESCEFSDAALDSVPAEPVGEREEKDSEPYDDDWR